MTAESEGENFLIIGQHLPKLRPIKYWVVFLMKHSVVLPLLLSASVAFGSCFICPSFKSHHRSMEDLWGMLKYRSFCHSQHDKNILGLLFHSFLHVAVFTPVISAPVWLHIKHASECDAPMQARVCKNRIDVLLFLAGCRKRQLNQAVAVLSLSIVSLNVLLFIRAHFVSYYFVFVCVLSFGCSGSVFSTYPGLSPEPRLKSVYDFFSI